MTSGRAATLFALLSPTFSVCILIWMSSRPPQYFHDQGGLRVIIFCFPLTFVVWLISALLSAVCGSQCPRQGPGAMSRDLRWINRMLIAAGLCLSLLTLVVR
jgi:hypothetical protein